MDQMTPLVLAVTCDDWRKRLWNSLTHAKERAQWWSAGITLEPQLGGHFSEPWTDDRGEAHETTGEVVACEPNARLTLSWHESDWEAEQQSQVSFELAGDEGRTRLVLTHSALSGFTPELWAEERKRFLGGWTELVFSLRNRHHGSDCRSGNDISLEKEIDGGIEQAWEMWTEASHLEEWLCEKAPNVSAVPAGPFELCWEPTKPEVNSTLGCLFSTVRKGAEFIAQWRGPAHLPLMSDPGSTLVRVRFLPRGKKTRVSLEHTGFGVGNEWRAAREWQLMAWKAAFARLG